ncbi:TPA: class I SAM-dependent methyltransferase [Enterococcus faecalis]|nr:class I SAM-dependent methyltransferase [Enterococcus faecalis]EHN4657737.1 class I SAM-dependent methyltransferase [Enterococcus faecalis]EHQ9062488.1 class I SAM-dependent methyltransferase [Enterococcus faecalis]EJX9275265.1 class I SAM-dependent methyltransferase [Enterococcus faecalis]
MKKILDVCCGSRMFWFDKQNDQVLFMDNRKHYEKLESGHIVDVNPNIVADFRKMPFEDNSFYHVVFDPPHLLKAGNNSWLAKKYGKLNEQTWKEDIQKGFSECMRVLKPNGTLVFKWNEDQIRLSEILSIIDYEPLYGNKRAKTHWLVFMKASEEDDSKV